MKILFVVYEALLGGHVLSAFTVANEMKRRGHDVLLAGKRGRLAPIIEKNMPFLDIQIPVFHGERPTYFTWKSLPVVADLRRIIKEHRIEIVHAFDARSYMHCYPAAVLENVLVTCTLCGGTDPIYNLPRAPKIIVFSEEQKAKMVSCFGWRKERVDVVRTRLDLGKILSSDSCLDRALIDEYRLASGITKIMMISSFDETKIRSIFKVLDAAEMLLANGRNFQMVLIGGKGPLHESARQRAGEINMRFGQDFVVLTGQVEDAFRLLQNASIVLGVGRSAFEGMACGKPTVIVGQNGFAGVVEPDSLEKIAYYNFSGRNQSKEVSAGILAEEITKLLDDPDKARELGEFGRDFVMREIDVKKGAERIEHVYKSLNVSEKLLNLVSFIKAVTPICYDNGAHRPKAYIKKMLKRLHNRLS